MNRPRTALIVLAALVAGGAAASAQAAPGPGGPVRRGFSSQVLVAQLSLYLPEEATRGMYRGPWASGAGRPGGGSGGRSDAAGGQASPQIQFTRDPALLLTKDQITKLLPILQALRDAPFPTPSKAKQVQADVDAQLTAGQKAEWAELQKKMQAAIEEFRRRMAASGGSPRVMSGGGADGDPDAAAGGQPGGPLAASLLERRQRQLDAFIEVLRTRLKQ